MLAWECLAKGFMTGKWNQLEDSDRAEKLRRTRRSVMLSHAESC